MGAWSDVVPAKRLTGRLRQVTALGAAYQVVSYVGILRALEPATRPTLMDGALGFAKVLDQSIGRA